MYHLHLTLLTLVAARVSDYSIIFGDRRGSSSGSIRGIIERPSSRSNHTESYKISLATYLYLI